MVFASLCILATPVTSQDYFWQINDVHYDPTYWTNQESCNIKIDPDDLGQYGHPECDAPWKLVEEAVLGMALEGGQPKFIIWSG